MTDRPMDRCKGKNNMPTNPSGGGGGGGPLMYEQLIHLSEITLRPNIQLLSNLQHAYQSV